jgi:subfamily B ATP-binding cassette protein MsbA
VFRRPSSHLRNSTGSSQTNPPLRLTQHNFSQLWRLLTFTRPYKWQLTLGLVSVVVASALQLAFPLLTRELFNNAFHNSGSNFDPSNINRVALTLIILFLSQAGFNFSRIYFLGLVGEGVVADLRKTLFGHLLGLSVQFFEGRKTGEITSRLTSDASTVQGLVSQDLAQFVTQLVTLVGGAIVLVIINLQLALVMLAVLPGVIIAGAYFGTRLREISTRFQDSVANANATAEEAIVGIRVVQSFTAEKAEGRRYAKLIGRSFAEARLRVLYRSFFVPSIILAMFTGITIVLWFGGRQVLVGNLLPGDLVAFLFLTLFVAGSVGSFASLYTQLQQALGASHRILELLDTGTDLPEPDRAQVLKDVSGHISFRRVTFFYKDRMTTPILKDVSLEGYPGEAVALVGPSGAGKSTLVTLIPRFYDPTQGSIRLDGIDLRKLDTRMLRKHIGIVPQETILFSGSIAENIRYGRPSASESDLLAAAKSANAHDFISAFPDSYQTLVGERGIKLSGGQRQRVAIARALLKDPRILILDEATSSLDSESESLVQAALEKLMHGRTTFVIAHRLSTIVNADRIIVLKRGRIVQTGTHLDLIKQQGIYRELYGKQFRASGVSA